MKLKIIPIIIALTMIYLNVSGQGWLDATNVVGNGNVKVFDMAIDQDGNTYITGWFDNNVISTAGSIFTNGNYDIFFLKINNDKTHAWIKGIGGSFTDLPGGVELGPDNTIYISGAINGAAIDFDGDTTIATSAADAFLANYNPDGTRNWVKIVAGGPKNQRSEAMRIDTDRIILSGLAVDSVIYDDVRVGRLGFFTHIATFDLNGNHLDYNTIGFRGPTPGIGLPLSIATTTDGYAISGHFRDSLKLDIDTLFHSFLTPYSDIFLYKINKSLAGQWVRRTTSLTPGENVGNSVKFDGNDNLYVAGRTESLDMQIDSTAVDKIRIVRTSKMDECLILKYKNSTGNLECYNIFGSNRKDGLWDIRVMPDKLVSTGFIGGDLIYNEGRDTLKNTTLTSEVFVGVHDLCGKLVHAVKAPSDPTRDDDQGYRVVQHPNGDIIVAGTYESTCINFEDIQFCNSSPGSPDIFLAQLGCLGDGSMSTSKTDVQCFGEWTGSITVTASGGFGNPYKVFATSPDTSVYIKANSPITISDLPAGTYDINVLDYANCDIGTGQITINQPAEAVSFTYTVNHPLCNGDLGSIEFSASGGTGPYEYSVNGTDFSTTNPVIDLPPDNYTLVVRDSNDCTTDPVDTTLVAPDLLTCDFIVNHAAKCTWEKGSIEFTNIQGGKPSYEYSIDGGANFSPTPLFSDLSGGSYSLMARDANGCTTPAVDTTLFAPDELMFDFTVDHPKCFGELGSITIEASGGTSPLQYSKDGGTNYVSENTFVDLIADEYSLIVMDDSGCVTAVIDTSILPAPSALTFTYAVYQPLCFGDLGCVKFTASGGTMPYEYSVDGGANFSNEDSICDLTEGDYSLIVRDANECLTSTENTSISAAPSEELAISVDSTRDITNDLAGLIEVSGSGGTSPYTFTLKPDGVEQDNGTFAFSVGEGGDYTIELADVNGCGPVETSIITITDRTDIYNSAILSATLYPNPTTGQLTIEMNYDQPELQLEIVSITGQVVLSRKAFTHAGVYKETLDLGHLGKGMYMLRVDGQVLSSKVLIE